MKSVFRGRAWHSQAMLVEGGTVLGDRDLCIRLEAHVSLVAEGAGDIGRD